MAGDITVALRADPKPFDAGTAEARAAVDRFVQAVESGADDASDAFADVLTELHKLGTATGRTGGDIARDFQKLGMSAEDAEDAVSALERETSDLGRSAPRDIDRAADAVDDLGDSAGDAGDDVGKIGDKASEAGDELRGLGDIARDVLGGDFESAAKSAKDALGDIGTALDQGGLTSSLIGLAREFATAWEESAEQSRQTTSAMFDDMVQSGSRMLSMQYQLAAAQELLNSPDKVRLAERMSEVLGIEMETAVLALIGNTEALGEAQSRLEDIWAREGNALAATKYSDLAKALSDVSGNLDNAGARASLMDNVTGALNGTTSAADEANAAIGRTADRLARGLPEPPPVKLRVDDSDVRNYRPPTVYIPGRIVPYGTVQAI